MAGKEEKVKFVKWFSELSNKDVPIAGGKGASLAEMYNIGMPVPPGFVITAQAYAYFIEKAGLAEKIKSMLEGLDIEETARLEETAEKIRKIITEAEMPPEMRKEIEEAYETLDANKKMMDSAKGTALDILKRSYEPPFVAVRSSATTEDLAEASFAGQQETFLNVKGNLMLINKVKACFASLFTARAVYYREKKGFGQEKAYLAVVVQKMINSDKSGVIFSINPVTGENNIMIEAVWGLGEGIVSGRIKPDNYIVDGNVEEFKILSSEISEKKVAIVRVSSGDNEIVKLTSERAKQQVLLNYELKKLAQYAKQLEEHYGKPQDIEFAIEDKDIFIVQSRPVTTLGKAAKEKRELGGEILASGLAASPGIGSGAVKIVLSLDELSKVKKGDVLVTMMTNPDMVVTMQKAAAIVTDEGGITAHAAIVSREMGIPAVVGTGNATKILKDEQMITVDGNTGKVYAGKGETKMAEVRPIVPTKTKIKVIVDLPDFAERAALSGAKAVGLTRIEGIIATSGKHPLGFLKQKKMDDYINVLYSGLKKIVAPFEEAWIRTSDIRSDEYRHLEGAPKEIEGNPMLGNHGIRFGLKNPEILRAEIAAIKKVAEEFPNKKLGIMMPQVISVEELRETKKIANEIDIPINVRIGIMVETPAAVQVINELCMEGISFVSFGTNDLTQYILAIDRNNADVQYIYNEMNPAVLSALSYVIRRCKRYKVETSICGQAGSREEMVRFLVKEGIDSISANADAAEKISKIVAEIEKNPNKTDIPVFEKKMPLKDDVEAKPIEPIFEKAGSEEADNMKELERIAEEKLDENILRQMASAAAEGPVIDFTKDSKPKNDPYEPAHDSGSSDIPALNDAIPIDARLLEENEKKEAGDFNLERELNG
jgi:pyruvate,water dikinase